MVPLIRSRQRVRVAPVDPALVEPGDIVLARVSGTVYLHLVSAVDAARRRVQIGNNRGRVNGWTGCDRVFGICLAVDDVPRAGASAKVRRPPVRTEGTGRLGSARLELLPLRVEHAAEMARVLGDPVLHEFTGGAPLTAGALRERYARLAAGSPDPAVVWCNWVLRLRGDGQLVGTVQATVTPARDTAELAWVIGTPWQGRGFATEAARALTAWLAQLPVGLLIAHVHPGHHASAAVAAACGFAPTPHLEDGETRWELRPRAARPPGA
ncbi:GNAT family N-acetyltransferase [Streptomyces flavotricini]|uniref:GNAT family N-acetyltransferase n=1 Tax=Streptomyces flavotricini TaxID=66888 RepID=A0ABS8EF40_9ACTN|nr:GNAT family N-acetyltransferase [Streptomyces flavotricini]